MRVVGKAEDNVRSVYLLTAADATFIAAPGNGLRIVITNYLYTRDASNEFVRLRDGGAAGPIICAGNTFARAVLGGGRAPGMLVFSENSEVYLDVAGTSNCFANATYFIEALP